jgi:hypothetical protein
MLELFERFVLFNDASLSAEIGLKCENWFVIHNKLLDVEAGGIVLLHAISAFTRRK